MRRPRIGWIDIPPQLKHRHAEIMGDIRGNKMRDCTYNNMLAGEVVASAPIANTAELIPSSVIEALEKEGKKMRDYQIEDLSLSLGRSAVFNINKPGYGKTLETIIWIMVNLGKDFKALVLCPKSVIGTWEAQLTKYWPTWAKDGFWWITNYQQLYSDERRKLSKEFDWDVVVLDESHTIKSFKSTITEICFDLNASAKHCLTGTPIMNRPNDLAAQLKWLDPYSITNLTDFQNCFCLMERDRWGSRPVGLTKDKKMVENLKNLLSIYTVGGEEHDIGVGEPERIKVRLKLDPRVKALYNKIVGEYDKELKQKVVDVTELLEQGVKVSSAIEAATRRQQLTSNPQLFDPTFKNVKFEWILDWLAGTDEKVVIFSKYAKTIDALDELLKKNKIRYRKVSQKQSAQERRKAIEEWTQSAQALIGTFGVLGTGTDGLQAKCRYAIFIDRAWTHAENDQAERRIYRGGGLHGVQIYILQAIGTIDIRIERVQHGKGVDAALLLEPVSDSDE